jgi:DNA replication protein DnaC
VLLEEKHFQMLRTRLRIKTFAALLEEMCESDKWTGYSFEEKMTVLIEAEIESRDNKRIAKNNKQANFSDKSACVEDIIYLPDRSLEKDRIDRLAQCSYIEEASNIVIVSETGGGKSFLAQALGNAACRMLYTVRYVRHSEMCLDLLVARNSGPDAYRKALHAFIKPNLLIIDDFMMSSLTDQNFADTFEVVESRIDRGSMILASIIEPEEWHQRIPTKTMADSLIDRIVHRSRFIDLHGPNMRKHLFGGMQQDG